MKAQNTILAMMLIVLMGMLGTACSSDTSSTSSNDPAPQSVGDDGFPFHKLSDDELNSYFASGKSGESVQTVDVTYADHLCPGVSVAGNVQGRFSQPDLFVFYKFTGVAGGTVNIRADRTECDVDLGMTLTKGVATTTLGVKAGSFLFNSSELEYITLSDDVNTSTICTSTCNADPEITYDIEEDGEYTIMVYRFSTCGGTTDDGFELIVTGDGIEAVSGCPVDTDGDGVDDSEDEYPESDTRAEVQIDGCDSGVDNIAVGNGAYMMDIINYCAANASNHGGFVSCVNYYANEWKAAGLISGNQKASIGSCASNSSLP